jgi:hypothetical protein
MSVDLDPDPVSAVAEALVGVPAPCIGFISAWRPDRSPEGNAAAEVALVVALRRAGLEAITPVFEDATAATPMTVTTAQGNNVPVIAIPNVSLSFLCGLLNGFEIDAAFYAGEATGGELVQFIRDDKGVRLVPLLRPSRRARRRR